MNETSDPAKHFLSQGQTKPQSTSFYAIVDGARDPSLHGHLRTLGRPCACLFAGPLEPQIERAAPYLVLLEPEDAFTKRWATEGRGQSWGIMFRAQADFGTMWRHLRKRLEVALPDGRRVLFRFYDPRVLRDYLPGCSSEELDFWFQYATTYWIEAEDGADLLVFQRQGDTVVIGR
ncbi:DUF4123 domain-containing protein [Microvirga pakistanensis]|uniref:DUF4123 domain-containing protein n=1 Tax=Microvirga pakistanensis TaxID=1682650 RepID=UPI00141A7548|nr:DUF4123 domain-containing protein [Microvirga pakistanensis]